MKTDLATVRICLAIHIPATLCRITNNANVSFQQMTNLRPRNSLFALQPFVLFMIALIVGSCATTRPPLSVKSPNRVLIVGNSFTYYNGGLEKHVKQLVLAANGDSSSQANRATKGGATLKILDNLPWVHETIRTGRYDVVIIQEDIPELKEHSVQPFFEHARKFNQEIKNAGGRTVFFMAWPYERLNWITQEQIAQAHREIGKELSAPVAAVGLAFQRSLATRPELAMLGRDKEHETIHGTYLAACVIFATLFDQSPVGLEYHP